jgi:isoleucyl-tRNA synthetase
LEIADVCCGSKLRRTQYEHMFSPLPLNTDAARVSLTVHSGLDFIDPGQGSVTPWAHTAPGRDTDMAAQQTVVTVVDDNASFLRRRGAYMGSADAIASGSISDFAEKGFVR